MRITRPPVAHTRGTMLLPLFCFLWLTWATHSVIPLVQQSNFAQSDTLDNGNRTICRNFTATYNSPVLYAVDDFNLPVPAHDNCSTLQLQFDVVVRRNGYDQAELTVTLQFLVDQDGAPGNQSLYQKTWPLPSDMTSVLVDVGGGVRMLTLLSLTVNLTDGEENFSLDTLQAQRRVWVGFYVNGPRNFNWENRTENQVYWALQHKAPASALLFNLVPNLDYYYRDANNLLGANLQNWSNASVTEQALNMRASSHNMAWSAQLLCHIPHAPTTPTHNHTLVTDPPPKSTGTVISLVAAFIMGCLLLLGILIWSCRQACNCLRRRSRKSSAGLSSNDIEMHATTRYSHEASFIPMDGSDGGIGLDSVRSEAEQSQIAVTQTALWLAESDQSDPEAYGNKTPQQLQDPRQAVRLQQAQTYIDNKKMAHANSVSKTKKND